MDSSSQAPLTGVPVALRVGGAFIALALIFVLFGLMSILSEGWMGLFPVTWRFILIVIAAALVGAFVTTNTAQKGSPAQVVGLAVAVALIIASRFVSLEPLSYMAQYWLFLYAGGALLCALLIRRSLMR
ncbi:hypothetical protein G7Y31_05935 [Corynebacterium lizhenjunii]|uniref:Uncharacterized protein n=1 Tax=Corynebacterium lizhenjunii TaxID=2709394 RepID=A0A7T0KGK9_9CORY|nr:hypothetical protein [Corynebacterium lizhenjunii]QPK80204.1 hypothetical protein G7Y31_05935 [Corynebacterium lizhenjunii]